MLAGSRVPSPAAKDHDSARIQCCANVQMVVDMASCPWLSGPAMPRRRPASPPLQTALFASDSTPAAPGGERGNDRRERISLPVDRLGDGSFLAPEAAADMHAATRVSMSMHHSRSPVVFPIREQGSAREIDGEVHWSPPSEQHLATYQYGPKRIELTAECIALAALRARDGLRVRKRSEELTGADWIVTPPDMDLEKGIRVEVSGIDVPRSPAEPPRRLAEKVHQLRKGQQRRPAPFPGIAVVVVNHPQEILLERVDLALGGTK